jgi:hypothetical protein
MEREDLARRPLKSLRGGGRGDGSAEGGVDRGAGGIRLEIVSAGEDEEVDRRLERRGGRDQDLWAHESVVFDTGGS